MLIELGSGATQFLIYLMREEWNIHASFKYWLDYFVFSLSTIDCSSDMHVMTAVKHQRFECLRAIFITMRRIGNLCVQISFLVFFRFLYFSFFFILLIRVCCIHFNIWPVMIKHKGILNSLRTLFSYLYCVMRVWFIQTLNAFFLKKKMFDNNNNESTLNFHNCNL